MSEDNGTYYRDPNAARYPDYPIAPAVKAVIDAANVRPIDADVFACGSTLGNLLRFVRGIDKPFRFSVEVIGDTVFFIRKENDPKQLIEGVRGFGHSFPDAYTTWPKEVKNSETHQRIIQYDLGGLQCLVRFECDGFLDDSPARSPSQSLPANDTSTLPSEDTLTAALSKTTLSAPLAHTTSPLSIKRAGKPIPQPSIFDLKTRSGRHKKEINMDDITPQLWLKQIPNFIVAYHDGFGLFQDIQIQDVKPLIADFEADNARPIRALVGLLWRIIENANAETRALEVYCPGTGVLEIRRQFGDGVAALPHALEHEWVAMCAAAAGGLEVGAGLGRRRESRGEVTPYAASDSASPGLDSGDATDVDDTSDGEQDFTACSADECGYCGRCTY